MYGQQNIKKIMDVVICEQPDACKTPLIAMHNTWCHVPDDSSLNQFLAD